MGRTSQAALALRCSHCRRTPADGAVFTRNRTKPSGYQNDCEKCRRRYKPAVHKALPGQYASGTREMTLEEVAEELGITRQAAHQIECRALRKLRKNAMVYSAVRRLLEGRS